MSRSFLLLLSVSALAVSACAEERSETEEAAENAAEETREALETAGENTREAMDNAGDAYNEARAEAETAMDGGRDSEDEAGDPDGGIGQSAPVNAVQDAASIIVGTVSGGIAGLTGDPATYVRNAYLTNMYQIEAGGVAAARGNSEEIRALGAMIVTEHEALQLALQSAVGEAGLELEMPQALEGRRQGLLDNLNAAADMDFDAAFLQQQTQINTELAALHNGFEARGEDGALVDYASQASDAAGNALEQITANYGAAVDGE
jgi:putative membrane protein